MKRIASIQDISCLGRCSLTVALPVISALGVECAIVPTAVLSAHTAFPGFVSRDLSDQLTAIAAHWRSQHVHFDALYTGYIASAAQVRQVLDFFDAVRSPDTMIFVDPAMADHGKLYTGFGPDFPSVMAQVVAQAQWLPPPKPPPPNPPPRLPPPKPPPPLLGGLGFVLVPTLPGRGLPSGPAGYHRWLTNTYRVPKPPA